MIRGHRAGSTLLAAKVFRPSKPKSKLWWVLSPPRESLNRYVFVCIPSAAINQIMRPRKVAIKIRGSRPNFDSNFPRQRGRSMTREANTHTYTERGGGGSTPSHGDPSGEGVNPGIDPSGVGGSGFRSLKPEEYMQM